jgi:glycosyltransferase involved in cell wall biosynthesis
LKIVHVIVGLDIGGAEMMLKRLILADMDERHCRHSVITLTTFGKIGDELRARGVPVTALGMRSVIDVPRVIWNLRRLIIESEAQIVQTWMYHADLLGGLAARLAGNRNVIWGIHSTHVQAGASRATTAVMYLCARLSCWVPKIILCVAEVSRRVHIAAGYDAVRMFVAPNGVNIAALVASSTQRAEFRAQCGFTDDHLVVGTVGRFNPVKDYENFVNAAAIVAKGNTQVRFVMIGKNLDSQNGTLNGWIDKTGCADRFVLLGERSDIPTSLAAMDVFCLSSRSEALPTVVAEAMAMGTPCVATDVGDTAVLIADTGYVVPKENSFALAEGLLRMLTNSPEARAELGQLAVRRIRAEFTIDCARKRIESIYRRAMET